MFTVYIVVLIMPMVCAVFNCSNRSTRDKKSFFRIPSIPIKASEEKIKLITLRRQRWLSALKRADINENKTHNLRICGDHFITGKPADIYDTNNPDWAPSLKMGYKKIKACLDGNSTEKFVNDDDGEGVKRGYRRKKLLLDGEIRTKTVSSPNETMTLAESIPIEYFQGSDIFSTGNSCITGIPVFRWTCSQIIQDSKTNKGILNKENTDANLRTEQSLSSVKESFTYQNLVKNLQFIKKPNDFWSINPIPNAVICARWSENYTCEKKLVIGNSLTVRVFLKEKWEINLSELMNITCLDDISNLLEKVENYKIIQFEDLK